MPNDTLPRRHAKSAAKRITRNLEPLMVRRPRVKPHRRFLCKLAANQEVIITAPVSVIAERDASLRVRFLTETETERIPPAAPPLDLSQQFTE